MICSSCGNIIPDTVGSCAYCNAVQPKKTESCRSCGKILSGNKLFCTACGSRQNGGATVQQNSQQQPARPINPPYNPYAYTQNPYGSSVYTPGMPQRYRPNPCKSRILAGLLGMFLGCIGVHNFYLGYTGRAIAQLLITVLSIGILLPVSAAWGFIEGILILCNEQYTDASGAYLLD